MIESTLRRSGALMCTVLCAGLAACGGDDGGSAAGGGDSSPEAAETREATAAPPAADTAELALAATEDGGLGWEPEALTAKPGTVTITMANPDGNQAPHAVTLEGDGVDESGDVVQAGGESTVTAELRAGEYTFYCPVGQHRQAGMEGTLTVQ